MTYEEMTPEDRARIDARRGEVEREIERERQKGLTIVAIISSLTLVCQIVLLLLKLAGRW